MRLSMSAVAIMPTSSTCWPRRKRNCWKPRDGRKPMTHRMDFYKALSGSLGSLAMDTSFLEFRAYILDRLLDLLWRQWSALGVPGRTGMEERRVIDPESLLLLSMTIGRYDARLFDDILAWLVVNGAFLNVQRLRNLMKRFDFQSQAQLAAISELLMKKSNDPLTWKRLATPRSPRNPEPLFFLKSGKPIQTPDEKAPEFSPYGLLRGPIKLRGHAQPFPTKGMPSLLLRLRALLGVNAHCELFCLLAAAEEIHPLDVP